jgi:hypothetical protein
MSTPVREEIVLRMTPQEYEARRLRAWTRTQQASKERVDVVWRAWDAGYERSFHGEPAVIELGDIFASE